MKNKKYVPGFSLNEKWLDEIDNEFKAYFLGLMMSDGYISTGNRIGLKLKKEDDNLVKEIFSKFSNNYGVNSRGIIITSRILYSKLKEYGIIENKTKFDLKIPDIGVDLLRHFVRGYFDGDGSISMVKSKKYCQVYICSVSKNILEEFKKLLNENKIQAKIYVENRKGKPYKIINKVFNNCKDMYTLRVEKHENLLKFYEFLYTDSNIKLERKYKIYKEYYANTVLTLDNKGSKAVQRIGDETYIDFEKLKTFCFWSWKEVPDMELIKKLHYENKISMNKLGKMFNYDRTSLKDRLNKYIKEYNSPKSTQTLT